MWIYKHVILELLLAVLTLELVQAYPQIGLPTTEENLRLSTKTANNIEQQSQTLERLYTYDDSLHRLKRALQELDYEEGTDDMELAEINVFRPLFRYRGAFAKQVKSRQQQFG